MRKFKIDFDDGSSVFVFGLYVERRGFLVNKWQLVERYRTQQECKDLHERIKDLPEYL